MARIERATPVVLHLRSETKPFERRSALTPTAARTLLEYGYEVNVEQSPGRIFDDEEFEAVGATMVPEGSWVDAPKDHIIIGLKEFPESDAPIFHSHIQFGHCFKNQAGWEKYLSRFARGGGTLYDIEYLTDQNGQRISAFGYWAGYAGAAVSLLTWSHEQMYPDIPFPAVPQFSSADALMTHVRRAVSAASALNQNTYPRILVMGALGRCGSGAIEFCRAAGIPEEDLLSWDMDQTTAGGPFSEISAVDIFINCVYLQDHILPFVTFESLSKPGRNLSIACDVSCDYNGPNNPIPIYHQSSTFQTPTLPIHVGGDKPLHVISIDNLPSLVAREASEAFAEPILDSLKTLDRRHEEGGVWARAEAVFQEKVTELPFTMREYRF